MKNFPNQANDLTRLRATLATVRDLAEQGKDADDDGVLGYELAQRRHYTFRKLDYNAPNAQFLVAQRLIEEQAKDASSQGTRTNAREMRRTLAALGWIGIRAALTPEGTRFLSTNPGSLDERALLANALWDLTVGETPATTSHPVRILLRLLAERPSDRREGLELALEAENDSEAEWVRVRSLYRLTKVERRAALAAKGVSDYQIANAVKIFPALAKTAGLVVEDGMGHLAPSPDGKALLASPIDTTAASVVNGNKKRKQRKTFRKVSKQTVASQTGDVQRKLLTPEEQEKASQQLADRTAAHQALVKATAAATIAAGELYEDPQSFDLLFIPEDHDAAVVLFEMKTIAADEEVQVRRAVGQLSWYHYFDVSPNWPGRAVIEVLVVDHSLSKGLLKYLRSEEVSVLLVEEAKAVEPLSVAESKLLSLFLPSQDGA